MATANQRIVVSVTTQEKRAIEIKAKEMNLSIAELMRRGVFDYESPESELELAALADTIILSIHSACNAIENSLSFIEESNKRIAEMELNAANIKKAR